MDYYDKQERRACEMVDAWLWLCKIVLYGLIAYFAAKGILS